MSKSVQQLTFLLALSFLGFGSGQVCIYRQIENHYTCELALGTYLNRGDSFVIGGRHIAGFEDQNVTKLTTSRDFDQDLRLIPETVFQRFQNLQTLDLSIGNIESLAGIPSCVALEIFIINENNLADASGLSQCTNLRYISIVSNRLTSVTSQTFQNLNQLTELILVNNVITRLSAVNLPNLEILNVGLNQINAIPRNFFNGVPRLINFNAIANLCFSGSLFPQANPDFNQALEQCFQNYDGSVIEPPLTTILPGTDIPIDPETQEPTTILPGTDIPIDPETQEPTTILPGTDIPTEPPTTEIPATEEATDGGSLFESKIHLTVALLLIILGISNVIT